MRLMRLLPLLACLGAPCVALAEPAGAQGAARPAATEDEVVARSDLLILCTPHRDYRNADLKAKPVVDVWGLLENANVVG